MFVMQFMLSWMIWFLVDCESDLYSLARISKKEKHTGVGKFRRINQD